MSGARTPKCSPERSMLSSAQGLQDPSLMDPRSGCSKISEKVFGSWLRPATRFGEPREFDNVVFPHRQTGNEDLELPTNLDDAGNSDLITCNPYSKKGRYMSCCYYYPSGSILDSGFNSGEHEQLKVDFKGEGHNCYIHCRPPCGEDYLTPDSHGKKQCFTWTAEYKNTNSKKWLVLKLLLTTFTTGLAFYRLYEMGFLRWIPCYVASVSTLWTRSNAAVIEPDVSSRGLLPYVLQPIPLGTIRPRGWLKDQLDLMGDGLAGHQHQFYRFVSDSPWIGGSSEYSLLHEAFPYWLNGFVPLAYGVETPDLAKKLQDAVEDNVKKVLARQATDGWLGPETIRSGTRNLWGRMPLLLAFIQLLEADPKRYENTLLPAVHKYINLAHHMLKDQDGFGYLHPPAGGFRNGMNLTDVISDEDHGWGQVRAADMMISLQWLYENDTGSNKTKLWDIMEMLRLKDNDSLDWARWYTQYENVIKEPEFGRTPDASNKKLFPFTHGVNVGQGLKAGAVINRFENNQTMVDVARKGTRLTFKYHGSASGSILADEQMEGLSPYYGTELCTTVETMYSLAYLYQALGDNEFADRAEQAAFNALPSAVMGDWWSHQYLTQPNQPISSTMNRRPFWNVNQRGQTFGLEPDYPCCTVNHPQGYPKFLSHSWATVGDNGVAHALLSPSALKMTLAGGANVQVEAKTNYPFSDHLHYSVSSDRAFNLYVRIPSWTDLGTTTFSVNDKVANLVSPDSHTGLLTIPLSAGTSTVDVLLSRTISTKTRMHDAESVFYGPLLYALDVGYAAEHHHPPRNFGDSGVAQEHVPEKCMDWDLQNTTSWNVAIDFTSLRPRTIRDTSDPLPVEVWSRNGPPVILEGTGCEIEWPLLYQDPAGGQGMPGSVPTDATCVGGVKKVRFIAAGSAKIGMVELPRMQKSVKFHKAVMMNSTRNELVPMKINNEQDEQEYVILGREDDHVY